MNEPAPLGRGEAVLAFDVGGTDTKSALVDADGRIVERRRTPTPKSTDGGADALVERLAGLAEELRGAAPGARPRAIGLSVPGIVDEARGVGVFSSNLGWRDAPIARLAEARLGLPVAFGHDVRRAGDAEHRLGAARGARDVVVLVIGTGVSAAVVLDGRPHTGGGFAGEIGHSVIDPDGAPCECGSRGCLETVASAGAVARRYRAETGIDTGGARAVVELARRGDATAARIWAEAVDGLALGIAQLAAVIAPEAVVIGGGLARAGAELFVPLEARLDARIGIHRRPELRPALLGEEAGLLGTALAARDLAARSDAGSGAGAGAGAGARVGAEARDAGAGARPDAAGGAAAAEEQP